MSSHTVQLKPGREKPVLHGHPWIFSGAIREWHGRPETGDAVEIFSSEGEWLARGLANPQAGLPVRIYTREQAQNLDAAFFAERLDRAIGLRRDLFANQNDTDAYRLVHSEADGLSGLIVDRYGSSLAARVTAAALLPLLDDMTRHLKTATGISRIHVSADEDDVEREKMDRSHPALRNSSVATERIRQDGFSFEVDISGGQKTGFYLDQRQNRSRIAAYAAGRRVLSCYCYTGALEVYLDRAGAKEITSMDSSGPALAQAGRHMEMNGVNTQVEWQEADVPRALRKFRDQARQFDLIVLDPPKFVINAAQKDRGLRAYKDINLLALKLLSPGGLLATFSCSGLVSREDLQTVLSWSAKDANRTVQVLEQLGQPPDHPVLVGVPETEYLHGFICRVS